MESPVSSLKISTISGETGAFHQVSKDAVHRLTTDFDYGCPPTSCSSARSSTVSTDLRSSCDTFESIASLENFENVPNYFSDGEEPHSPLTAIDAKENISPYTYTINDVTYESVVGKKPEPVEFEKQTQEHDIQAGGRQAELKIKLLEARKAKSQTEHVPSMSVEWLFYNPKDEEKIRAKRGMFKNFYFFDKHQFKPFNFAQQLFIEDGHKIFPTVSHGTLTLEYFHVHEYGVVYNVQVKDQPETKRVVILPIDDSKKSQKKLVVSNPDNSMYDVMKLNGVSVLVKKLTKCVEWWQAPTAQDKQDAIRSLNKLYGYDVTENDLFVFNFAEQLFQQNSHLLPPIAKNTYEFMVNRVGSSGVEYKIRGKDESGASSIIKVPLDASPRASHNLQKGNRKAIDNQEVEVKHFKYNGKKVTVLIETQNKYRHEEEHENNLHS